jgi:hypothetical protein
VPNNANDAITQYQSGYFNLEVDIIAIGNGEGSIWEDFEPPQPDDQGKNKFRDGRDTSDMVEDVPRSDIESKERRKDTPSKGINWLNDPRMLPGTLQNSRIMEFLYSKDESQFSSLMKVTGRFLQFVSEKRQPILEIPIIKTPFRPVIFIAHGHGSLILELAFMLSYRHQHPPAPSQIPESAATGASPRARPLSAQEGTPGTSVTRESATVDQASKVQHENEPPSGVKPTFARALNEPTTSVSGAVDAEGNNRAPPSLNPFLDMENVAGVILLGTPREVPQVDGQEASGTKSKLDQLLDICLDSKTFNPKAEKMEGNYHACFQEIVDSVGLAVRCYWGSDKYKPEAGRPFKVRFHIDIAASVSCCPKYRIGIVTKIAQALCSFWYHSKVSR